jgi:hypothetical protein
MFILILLLLYFPVILFAHWVGDYLLQIPFKTHNGKPLHIEKSRNSLACAEHCLYYSIAHCLIFSVYLGWLYSIICSALIGLFHFFQDRHKWPMKYFMILIAKNGTNSNWYPSMYIIIDNGYHIFLNTAIITLFFVVQFL